ncbi:MAG: BCD family MFS transporter [Rhodobacteraceae bacterium]|nr:BCD family MFS transporter [Paracoccaceae bacterium]
MKLGWVNLVRLCLANAAIGGLAALPVNLFNRLMTVELDWPAMLPGLLVALHYGVQLTRPYWGHRSDAHGGRTRFILGGIALVGAGLVATAWAIARVENSALALAIWVVAYTAIGLGIGAAGTSFLALLASAAPDRQKGALATLAWLMLIFGAIVASVGTGIALDPYTPDRLMAVVPAVAFIALGFACIATVNIERRLGPVPALAEPGLGPALKSTWADQAARRFTGFVFLSILAFYLSELILEPFAGHVHGLPPEDSTRLAGGKDGAALIGMIAAGTLSYFYVGSLRTWAIIGCGISAAGLAGLATGLNIWLFTIVLGLGNGLFVVGAVGSMMRLAAKREGAVGTRMGVFGAAQAIAAGIAGLIATGIVDIAKRTMPIEAAYGTVFVIEALLFIVAALVAMRLLHSTGPEPALQPGK